MILDSSGPFLINLDIGGQFYFILETNGPFLITDISSWSLVLDTRGRFLI